MTDASSPKPRNGRTGAELHKNYRPGDPEWPAGDWKERPTIRTQRTKLQSALLAHVPPGVIRLSKKLESVSDLGDNDGVELNFADGTAETADLVVGADGIRSVRCPPRMDPPHDKAIEALPIYILTAIISRSSGTPPGQTTR